MLRRMRAALAAALVITISAGCLPNRKSLDVVNACSQGVRVRVWDRPEPGDTKDSFFKERAVPPVSLLTIEEVVTDNGDRDWSAEILIGPGAGEVLSIKRSKNPVLVIPARLCSG